MQYKSSYGAFHFESSSLHCYPIANITIEWNYPTLYTSFEGFNLDYF